MWGSILKSNIYVLCLSAGMLSACMGQAGSSRATVNGESVGSDTAAVVMKIPAAPSPLASAGDITQSRFGARALSYLGKNRARYGITDAEGELIFLNETIDDLKQGHVRFQQVKKGVPVWGHQIIVHCDETGNIVSTSGSFLPDLGDVDVRPSVTVQAAEAAAVAAKGEYWRVAGSTLYLYEHESRPKLVYYVTLTRGLERWFVMVSAHDGAVLHEFSGMPSFNP